MSDDGWGFADMYGMDDGGDTGGTDLEDVRSDDWRNILVLGRASGRSVYPETKSLIGHARHLADQLGCRVEVLLIGSDLDAAVEDVKKYAVDNVYTVQAPDYAPIQQTAGILAAVVKKRRPELVLVFQSRSGDAITPYAAAQLGAGFALGALRVEIDTMERRTEVTHQGKNHAFQVTTQMLSQPAFITVQRGTFRAPMEDPYSTTKVHALEVDVGPVADVQVLGQRDPPAQTIATAERVVVAGARVRDATGMQAARDLAARVGAVFGVTQGVLDRGLAGPDDPVVNVRDHRVGAKLVLAVGCMGSLDLMEALADAGTIIAVASGDNDPINGKSAYRVEGSVEDACKAILDGL